MFWKKTVTTRGGGASKWIKARMDSRIPPTLPTVDKVLFSPEDAATNLEKYLSVRWNTGVRRFYCEACGNTTNFLRNAKELTWKKESPRREILKWLT